MSTQYKSSWSKAVWFVSLWMIPIVALVGVSFIYYFYWAERGPVIEINFREAPGVEAGKTPLQYRGIQVGAVERVQLSENDERVNVRVRMNLGSEELASEGARFWIVQPKVSITGISGLDTLVKGTYIRMEKGKGDFKSSFVGEMESEETKVEGKSVNYTVRAQNVGSLNTNDPISFRGVEVGVISKVQLAEAGDYVEVNISMPVEYVKFVRENTVFWEHKAIQADLSLFGSDIDIGSLQSIMRGGLSFATPTEAGPLAKANAVFRLTSSPPDGWEQWSPALSFE